MISAAKKNIWVLDDGRPGNTNQAKAIAHYLGDNSNIQYIPLHFSRLISLPNLLSKVFKAATNLKEHIDSQPKPDLVISSGRRSALAALQLKKIFPSVKIVQNLRPNLPAKNFDFIVTPVHDNYQYADYQTIISPNIVNGKQMDKARNQFPEFQITEKIFFIALGGDTKNNIVSGSTLRKFCDNVENIAKNDNIKIYICTSRRTNRKYHEILRERLSSIAKIYFWENTIKHNPYLALLSYANYLAVTQDSISMIGECLATGKPTYVFSEGFGDSKHQEFCTNLTEQKLIRDMQDLNHKPPANWKYSAVNEAQNCAKLIVKKFAL